MTSLQFGKYPGKSFVWLLQNDVGWATMLMADQKRARETAKRYGDPQWDNKEALFRLVQLSMLFLSNKTNLISVAHHVLAVMAQCIKKERCLERGLH